MFGVLCCRVVAWFRVLVLGFDFVLVMFVCYHLFRVRARCVLVVLVSSLCFGFWFLFCVNW